MKGTMMSSRTKSTNAELQNRIDIVIDCLSKKMKRAQIINLCLTEYKDWDIGYTTVDNYLRKARNQMIEQVNATRQELRSEAANDLRYLYKKCLDEGDYSTALRVRKELSDMFLLKGAAIDPPLGLKEKDVTEALPDEIENMFTEKLEIANPIVEEEKVIVPDDNVARMGRPKKEDASLARFGY